MLDTILHQQGRHFAHILGAQFEGVQLFKSVRLHRVRLERASQQCQEK